MLFTPPDMPQSVTMQKGLTAIHIDEWLRDDVFHLRWWILIALLLICMLVWLRLLDKAKLKQTCLFAVIELLFTLALVEYGDELLLWDYPTDVIPVFPPLTSLNLLLLPLAYSLAYQRFPSRNAFIGACLIVTAIICFIIEPLLAWGGFYELVNWRYYLSFPVYFATALLARFIVTKIIGISEKNKLMG